MLRSIGPECPGCLPCIPLGLGCLCFLIALGKKELGVSIHMKTGKMMVITMTTVFPLIK